MPIFDGEAAGYQPEEMGLYRPYEVKAGFAADGGEADGGQDLGGGLPQCPPCPECNIHQESVINTQGCPQCQTDLKRVLALGGVGLLDAFGLVYALGGGAEWGRVKE